MTHPYRASKPIEAQPAPRRWLRPLCWLIGHRWVEIRVNTIKAVHMAMFHPLAGSDADCKRCGAIWRDA